MTYTLRLIRFLLVCAVLGGMTISTGHAQNRLVRIGIAVDGPWNGMRGSGPRMNGKSLNCCRQNLMCDFRPKNVSRLTGRLPVSMQSSTDS